LRGAKNRLGPLPELAPSCSRMFPSVRLALFLAFSALAFGADYQIEANIRYGTFPENVLDIVQSPAPALKNRPGVIVIHGADDKSSVMDKFCVPLAKHDFVVANVEYRSSEPAPVPTRDVMTAAQWFHKHAERFKVDASQILALGEGSGGTLALWLVMAPASADLGPVTRIVAVVNFYGAASFGGAATTVRHGLPPILNIHGDEDLQSGQLTKSLKEAGDDAELILVPGGKDALTPDEMARLWPRIFKWLKKRKIGA
jgi:acetyl esterase/lipase